ncbi:MAG: hypothetical protein ACRDLA_07525 [Thermoleophilaceae bacterium]
MVAVSFELLPERIDLVSFVLQGAGAGALAATSLAVIRRPDPSERARWIELGNAFGAAVGLVIFIGVALWQEVS